MHQEAKSFHLKAYRCLIEEALESKIVSAISAKRPEHINVRCSGATPTVSINWDGGANHTLGLSQQVGPKGNLPKRAN